MAFIDDSAPDAVIERNGTAIGYRLHEDESGIKQWFPGFVPENVSEQQQGAFSYDGRPKSLSQPLPLEDWSGGCGVVDAPPGTVKPTTYSYTRGIDASWGQPCLSPEFTAMTGISAPVLGFYRAPTNGWYAWTSTKIYRLAAGEWVEVYTPAATPTSMIEYQNSTANYIFVALGDSTDFVYTTSATFASVTTVTSEKASYFAVRGATSVEPLLFATKQNGLTRSSVNPISSGNWSNEDQIGRRNETVRALLTAHDLLWYLKEEGIYTFDGTLIGTLLNADLLKRTGNGAVSVVGVNGHIFTAYGNRVLHIDTLEESVSRFLSFDHPELNGTIKAMTADLRYLYVIIENAEGNSYLVKKSIVDDENPHTIAYLGAVNVEAMLIIPASSASPSSTNPILALGYDSQVRYAILPREGYRPWEDGNCRFDIGGGVLYGSHIDKGAAVFPAFLNSGRLITEDTTGAQSAVGGYSLDGASGSTSLVTASSDGLSVERVTSEVEFTRIRHTLTLATGSNRNTPRVLAYVLDVTPTPPSHRAWVLTLEVDDQGRAWRRGGEKRPVSYKVAMAHLLSSRGQLVTYTDYFGDEFVAKVLDVAVQGVTRKATGTGRAQATSIVQVSIGEIAENATITSPFIWGAATTGAGGSPWSAGYQYAE